MTNSDLNDIFKQPGKLAIFAVVFVVVVWCSIVLANYSVTNSKSSTIKLVLKNQPTISQSNGNSIVEYEKKVNLILSNYLRQRNLQNFKNKSECKTLVNQTVNGVLQLIVPVEYKAFHLRIVVLLDQELNNCNTTFATSEQNLENEWNNLLAANPWVNQ